MAITVRNVFRALAGEETGRACRSCHEPISAGDAFGFSEGVCRPCREAPKAGLPAPPRTDPATDAHLRIMVEQMVREGRPQRAIEEAVRRAA